MATYYWVGGSGTWDTTSTTNWAATSGGAGGAGVPTSADTVVFDVASGAVTVTLGEDVSVLVFNASAFTGTLAFSTFKIVVTGDSTTIVRSSATMTCTGTRRIECNYAGSTGTRTITTGGAISITAAPSIYVSAGTDTVSINASNHVYDLNFSGFSGSFVSSTRTIYGSLVFSPTMTITAFATLTFAATSVGQTLDFGGIPYDANVTFNGVGGGWSFVRNFATGPGSRAFLITNGTVDGNGYNITSGQISFAAGTKTLNLGSGTWTFTTGWNMSASAGGTINASTSTIICARITDTAFFGGGFTYNNLVLAQPILLVINQSNTFASITNTAAPCTFRFTAGTTQTVANFAVAGTAGNLVSLITSTAGSTATLTDSSGANTANYASIKDIVATGGATWTATNSTDAGNNTGWIFESGPVAAVTDSVYDLRSFTEKRRF